jgi:hypothetical protein
LFSLVDRRIKEFESELNQVTISIEYCIEPPKNFDSRLPVKATIMIVPFSIPPKERTKTLHSVKDSITMFLKFFSITDLSFMIPTEVLFEGDQEKPLRDRVFVLFE